MADYRLTLAARSDYENIGHYTQRQWGAKKRRQYLSDLVGSFEQIADNIHLGISRDDVRKGLRSYLCGEHVIFLRQGKDGVEIIRILHSRASVERAFIEK